MTKTLSQKTSKDLKESYPLYPTVRKEITNNSVEFSTLVRKRYDGKYYLIPMKHSDPVEAKAIHGIHSKAHKYLMLGVLTKSDILDDNQINEVQRLTNIK
jgi:hypothetical protein